MTEKTVVNEPVEAATTPTEPTPVENKTEVVESEQDKADKAVSESLAKDTEGEDKPEPEKVKDEVKPDETEEAEPSQDTQPQGKAEERKQQLNAEIRDLVSTRNALKTQVEAENAKVYQPATETDLLGQVNPETGEYYNTLEAKVAAMQQSQEMERYNTQVAEAQLTLSHEAQNALRDFPMFDETSKEYNKELAAQIDPILGANIVFDPNTGQPIGSHVSPYELYKTYANAAQLGTIKGQIKGQKATEKMQSRVDSTSGAAPTKSDDDDPFLKGLRGTK